MWRDLIVLETHGMSMRFEMLRDIMGLERFCSILLSSDCGNKLNESRFDCYSTSNEYSR